MRFWYGQGDHDYVEVTITDEARSSLWRQRTQNLISTAEEERTFIERTAAVLDRLGRLQCQADGVKAYSGYGSFPIATAAGRNSAAILACLAEHGLLLLHRPDPVFTLHEARFIDNTDTEWALRCWPRGSYSDFDTVKWS